jgi:hypothetical protein
LLKVCLECNFNKYIICVIKQCIHFTFKNNEINGAAEPALKSENSPANPPHLTTVPLTLRKKRIEKKKHQELLLSRRIARHGELSFSALRAGLIGQLNYLQFAGHNTCLSGPDSDTAFHTRHVKTDSIWL